jgi:hypothetical protein
VTPYTIARTHKRYHRRYNLVNPSGVTVAFWMTWRVARMVCDSVNETREARASAGEWADDAWQDFA